MTRRPKYGWHPDLDALAREQDEYRYIKIHKTWWDQVRGNVVGPVFVQVVEIANDPDEHLELILSAGAVTP